MECPQCNKELKPKIVEGGEMSTEWQDVDFECENEHLYFVRIRPDDLIEV